jgi:hypothetical protein
MSPIFLDIQFFIVREAGRFVIFSSIHHLSIAQALGHDYSHSEIFAKEERGI